jgi:hypothetical protein
MAANKPIFVVGCPRSGTTLLTLMLHSHSRIAMPPETRFVLTMLRRRHEFGDLRERGNRRKLARAITRSRGLRIRDLGVDRKQLRRTIVDGPPTLGSAIGASFRAYAARFDKPRWGDKRPSHFRNIDAIHALFPEAQFIHLIRDARDCAASLKQVPWGSGDVASAAAMWTQAIDLGRRHSRRLPAGTYLELRYEELVADPGGTLRAVCAFLGEEFEDGMLEPQRVADDVLPDRLTFHPNTRREITTSRIGGYAAALEPWEVRLVEFVAGRRLRRLGYSVPRSTRPPRPVPLLRYWWQSAAMRLGTRKAALADRRTTASDGPVADVTPG